MHTVNYNYPKTLLNIVFFNISCGESTGTYSLETGLYGLTGMPAEFQKTMNSTLVSLQNTFYFLGDIIIVSAISEYQTISTGVIKFLEKLNEDNLRINLRKCQFAETENKWLCYKLTQTGISPPELRSRVFKRCHH